MSRGHACTVKYRAVHREPCRCPGESKQLTPWARDRRGRFSTATILAGVCTSPLGTLYALALLILLWVSGCV